MTNCTDCRPGRYQSKQGQATCNICPHGYHTIQFKSRSCEKCNAGYYCPDPAGKAVPCPRGKKYCPAGSFTPQSCGGMFEVNRAQTECNMGEGLIAIIAVTVIVNLAIILVTIIWVYRKRRLSRNPNTEKVTLIKRSKTSPLERASSPTPNYYTGL
jgi:hypothetical protein